MDFSISLINQQKRLGLKQAQLCKLLFGVPLRTLQSWMHGEKLPPLYYRKLILHYLAEQAGETGKKKEVII